MSLNVALNTAVSGLFANQQAIAATSENIANVNTPEFSRREVTFYTDAIPRQFSGVKAEIARSASDRYLEAAVYNGAAQAAGAGAIADGLSRIEATLGAPGENISFVHAFDEAFAAFATLAANPASVAAKADALSALDAAFASLARTRGAIETEITASDDRIQANVERANALLSEIADLNAIVPESPGAADLLSARLKELAALLPISVTRNEFGQATVALSTGGVIANPAGANTLGLAAGAGGALALTINGAAAADFTGASDGGEIGGLLQLRNVDLPALLARVTALENDAASAFNSAYAVNVPAGANAPAGNALLVADANGFSVNGALIADPASLAVARPAAGAAGATDGSGAAALAAIADTGLAGGMRETVSLIGAASANAGRAAETYRVFADDVSARLADATGVNLDEELSNLIVYQRAYGANARVIAAVDELWQTLLNTI